MSAGDDQLLPATGPVESGVLIEMARADGGLVVQTTGGLRVLRGGRAGGEPDAPTVVLLHGRGHAAPIWFPSWAALAAHHRLLAVDLPGFGGSAAPAMATAAAPGADVETSAQRGLRFFADPVEHLLVAEVSAGRAAAGVVLVGHSLGGLVALELALRGGLPIRRLVLIDGMGLGPAMTLASRLFFRAHPERLARALGARLFSRINPSPPTPLGRRVAALEYELLTARDPPRVRARRAAARAFDHLCPLFGPVLHRGDRLPGLALPALLLWGDGDAALPVGTARAARDRMPSATLLTFPTGHSPHLDAPEAILPPLLDFLSAISRAVH